MTTQATPTSFTHGMRRVGALPPATPWTTCTASSRAAPSVKEEGTLRTSTFLFCLLATVFIVTVVVLT